ncbi:unnamed protein product, partial [Prorocentrum cordatum]
GARREGGAEQTGLFFCVDTRMFGRPDIFEGIEAKWAVWSTVMRACAGLFSSALAGLTPTAGSPGEAATKGGLGGEAAEANASLYYLRAMLTRSEPLNIAVNSGEVRQCCSDQVAPLSRCCKDLAKAKARPARARAAGCNCGGKGHAKAQCPTKKINALDEDGVWQDDWGQDEGERDRAMPEQEKTLEGSCICGLSHGTDICETKS